MVSEEVSYDIVNDGGGPNTPSLDTRVYESLRDHTWITLTTSTGGRWEFNALYASSYDKSGNVTFVGYAKNPAGASIASQLDFHDDDTVTLRVGVPS